MQMIFVSFQKNLGVRLRWRRSNHQSSRSKLQWGGGKTSKIVKWVAMWANFFLLSPFSPSILKPNLQWNNENKHYCSSLKFVFMFSKKKNVYAATNKILYSILVLFLFQMCITRGCLYFSEINPIKHERNHYSSQSSGQYNILMWNVTKDINCLA